MKLTIDGVSRTSSRGVPAQILQKKFTTKDRINDAKGTVKACVLERVTTLYTCTLVACSIYNTKPVHSFLVCCNNTTWLEKTSLAWDKSTSTMRLGRFIRLAINDSYNMNTNKFDIADQLRGSYCPDRWMRKQMWWRSMLCWGHSTLLVNAYIA